MAEQFKIKSLTDYQKQLNTVSPVSLPKIKNVNTSETLYTQKQNLEKRLRAVGVNPENPGDGVVDNRNFLERALNLTPDQNVFFDVLEVIDRPIRATFAGAQAAFTGEDVVGEFMKGLSGESDVMFTDILDSANILSKESLSPLESFILDLGAEVFLDPLNALPKGFLRKALGLKPSSELKLVDIPTSFRAVDDTASAFVNRIKNTPQFAKKASSAAGYIDPDTKLRIFNQEGFENSRKVSEARKAEVLANPSLADEGELYEIYGKDIIEAALKNDAVFKGEIDVLKNATNSAGSPDLSILKKVEIDGQTYWVEIGRIEAKGVDALTGVPLKDVRYASPHINLSMAEDGSEFVNVGFSKKVLDEVSANVLKDFETAFNLPAGAFKNNVTLFDLFQDLNTSSNALNPIVGTVDSARGVAKTFKTKLGITAETPSLKSLVTASNYNTKVKIKKRINEIISKAKNNAKAISDSDIDEVTDYIFEARKTYKDALKQAGVSLGVTFDLDFTKQEDFLRTRIRKFLSEKYKSNPYLMYVDKQGVSSFLHTDQVIETLDITSAKLIRGPGGFRFQLGLGSAPGKLGQGAKTLADFNLTDAKSEFIKYLMDSNESLEKMLGAVAVVGEGATRQALVEVRRPAKLMEVLVNVSKNESPINVLQRPAKLAVDTIEKLKYTFNLAAGYNNTFKAQIGRIQGKAAFKLNDYATRIFETEKVLKKLDPAAGRYLKDLIEMGVTPDELAQGLRLTHTKTANTLDVIDYYIRNTEMGKPAVLDAFEDDLSLRNAETALNKMFESFGIDATATIVKSSDLKGTMIKVSSDLEIKEIKKMIGKNPILNRNYLEFSYGTKQLDSGFRDFVELYSQEYANMLDLHDEISSLIVNELGVEGLNAGVLKELGYYRHSLTRDAKKAFRDTSPITRSKYSREGSNLFATRTYEAGVDAVNSVTRDIMELDYDLITDDGFASLRDTIESALTVETQHKVLGAILQESIALDMVGSPVSFFKVIDNNRQIAKDLGPSYVFIADGLEIEFSKMFDNLDEASKAEWKGFMEQLGYVPGEKAIAINKSVYETLKGVNNAYVEVNEFVKAYDTMLNTWKSTTLLSPGFHIRNFFGNMTNMYIGGMNTKDILKYQGNAVNDFNTYFKYRNAYSLEGIDAIPEAYQKAFLNIRDYFDGGLAQTRKGLRDFEKLESLALQGYDPTKKGFRETYKKVVQANFHAAEYIDDIQRYALYRWSLDQNKLFTEIPNLKKLNASEEIIDKYRNSVARQNVMDALFDYTNLTSFEKDYVKRLIPFYTFMKNNFAFQLKSIIDNPVKYRRLGQAYTIYNEEIGGISVDDLPDYAKDNLWIALPFEITEDNQEAISFLRLNLPPTDFAEVVENPFKKGVNSLAFPLKIPIEYGFMRDSFTGQEFEKFPGQENRLEPGKGVAAFLRDERGNLALSANPVVQKLMNDIGLRVPQNYLSIAFDVLDGMMGYQTGQETFTDIIERLGVAGTQQVSQMELTKLYQDLEYLRELRSLYEQQSGNRLPSLDQLGIKD